jgi:hypothetical protein
MTLRAWLLVMATVLAAVVAALTWPDTPVALPISVGEHALQSSDLAQFQQVCDQITTDRADYARGQGGAEIPTGLGMREFVHITSVSSTSLGSTCVRAGVTLKDFLEIVASMSKAADVQQRLTRFIEGFERRAEEAESMAQTLEELGKPPPPGPNPDDPPPWLKDLPQEVRESLAAWAEIRDAATAAWNSVMFPGRDGTAGDGDTREDE